jgi:hypothetical protein
VTGRKLGLPDFTGAAEPVTDDLLELLPALWCLPRRLDQIGSLAERGELTLRIRLFADRREAEHLARLADRLVLAFFSASVGLVSVLLLALPASSIRIGGTRLDQIIGYAGLTAATILGLRVLAAGGTPQVAGGSRSRTGDATRGRDTFGRGETAATRGSSRRRRRPVSSWMPGLSGGSARPPATRPVWFPPCPTSHTGGHAHSRGKCLHWRPRPFTERHWPWILTGRPSPPI